MGFADRMNEGLRGAKTVMQTSEVRQRLLEAQLAQDQAFARLGVVVHTAYARDGADAVGPKFLYACQQADAAARAVVALQAQLDAILAAQDAPAMKYCVSCGVQMDGAAAFCPSCGASAV
jgi:hypothetical protein